MRKAAWLAPLTGVLFVVVGMVSFGIAGEPPDIGDATLQEIVDFYSDNGDAVMIGSTLAALAGALLVFFGAALRRALQVAETDGGYLSLVAFAGTVIIAIGFAFDATINFALADTVDELDPRSAQTLLALWNNDFIPMMLGMFLFLTSVGIAVVRDGALPKWIGWVALVLAVIALTPIGFASFLGGAILIVAISIVLTMRTRTASNV